MEEFGLVKDLKEGHCSWRRVKRNQNGSKWGWEVRLRLYYTGGLSWINTAIVIKWDNVAEFQCLEKYFERRQLKRIQQGNSTSCSYNSSKAYMQVCNLPINTGKSFPLTPPLTNHLHIQLPLQVANLHLVFPTSLPQIFLLIRDCLSMCWRK